ncbi:MAG: hypothetical protein WBV94_32585 [Blastocatellia bacterium]
MIINESGETSMDESRDNFPAGEAEDTGSANPAGNNIKAPPNAPRAGGHEDTRENDGSADTFEQPQNVTRSV